MKMVEGVHFNLLTQYRDEYAEFFDNYTIIELTIPPDGDQNTKGTPKRQRICRFCNCSMPEVRFKSKAHIIPKNVFGKNYGISNFECDSCNNKFSLLETHAANYFGLIRTINSLGNNKVPSFIPRRSVFAKLSDAFEGKKVIQIKDIDERNITFDKVHGTIQIKFTKEPYIPINIYKLLLKIGLSIIRVEDVEKYRLAMDFLMNNMLSDHFQHFAQVKVSSLEYRVRKPYCILFEKISESTRLCKHMVQLYFHNQMWMFFLPLHDSDISDKKYLVDDVKLCPPILIPEADVNGKYEYTVIKFNSTEAVCDDQGSIKIRMLMDEEISDSLPDNFAIEDSIYLSADPFL